MPPCPRCPPCSVNWSPPCKPGGHVSGDPAARGGDPTGYQIRSCAPSGAWSTTAATQAIRKTTTNCARPKNWNGEAVSTPKLDTSFVHPGGRRSGRREGCDQVNGSPPALENQVGVSPASRARIRPGPGLAAVAVSGGPDARPLSAVQGREPVGAHPIGHCGGTAPRLDGTDGSTR